jgi:arylsulfatase
VDQAEIRTMTGHFAITGEGLCIGFDSGDQVSRAYKPEFTGGQIIKVVFDVADDVYTDVEAHFAAAMARD